MPECLDVFTIALSKAEVSHIDVMMMFLYNNATNSYFTIICAVSVAFHWLKLTTRCGENHKNIF